MKLLKMYRGVIETMCNTPCRIAVFTDGKNIKVFQKNYFRNFNPYDHNWTRNVILERRNTLNSINDSLTRAGFLPTGNN